MGSPNHCWTACSYEKSWLQMIQWEEYFKLVFKYGVRVRTTDKESAWERMRTCFDYYCVGVPAPEARSLMRKSTNHLYQMLDKK